MAYDYTCVKFPNIMTDSDICLHKQKNKAHPVFTHNRSAYACIHFPDAAGVLTMTAVATLKLGQKIQDLEPAQLPINPAGTPSVRKTPSQAAVTSDS